MTGETVTLADAHPGDISNKCGFKIVEFFNRRHPDPHQPEGPDDLPGDSEAFRFEKIMRSA